MLNANGVEPLLPSLADAVTAATDTVRTAISSLTIVAVTEGVLITRPAVGEDSVKPNVSLASGVVSPTTAT